MAIYVKSQKELDAVPKDAHEQIVIQFGTQYNRAVVRNKYWMRVAADAGSSVVAWGNSSVEA